MNFHIMDVEPPGSVVGGGESGKFLRLLTDSYAVTDLEVIYKLTALDSLTGGRRFLH
jgi:hypothetical protein